MLLMLESSDAQWLIFFPSVETIFEFNECPKSPGILGVADYWFSLVTVSWRVCLERKLCEGRALRCGERWEYVKQTSSLCS